MAPASFGPLLLLPGPKSGSPKADDAGIVKAPAVRAKANIFLRMGTSLTR